MRASRLIVHCFAGFLGRPQDLEFLRAGPPEARGIPLEWRFQIADPVPEEDWQDWARRWLHENPPAAVSREQNPVEILLGYSLGGRAAAHLALAAPRRFSGLIAISTNPGLVTASERASRLAADEAWARRFENEDWNTLFADWNSQAVFGGAGLPDRLMSREGQISDELRGRCARQLRQFSLGRQEDLAPGLLQWKAPQVWMTGENDLKFTELTRRLSGSRLIRREVVPNAGHRWPWELNEVAASRTIARAINFLVEQDSP